MKHFQNILRWKIDISRLICFSFNIILCIGSIFLLNMFVVSGVLAQALSSNPIFQFNVLWSKPIQPENEIDQDGVHIQVDSNNHPKYLLVTADNHQKSFLINLKNGNQENEHLIREDGFVFYSPNGDRWVFEWIARPLSGEKSSRISGVAKYIKGNIEKQNGKKTELNIPEDFGFFDHLFFSPKGTLVAMSGEVGLFGFEIRNVKGEVVLSESKPALSSIDFSSDDNLIGCATSETVGVKSGREIFKDSFNLLKSDGKTLFQYPIKGLIYHYSFSPDDSKVAISVGDQLIVFNLSGEVLHQETWRLGGNVQFVDDERILLTDQGRVWLLNLKTGKNVDVPENDLHSDGYNHVFGDKLLVMVREKRNQPISGEKLFLLDFSGQKLSSIEIPFNIIRLLIIGKKIVVLGRNQVDLLEVNI